jgi:hypothetical protein
VLKISLEWSGAEMTVVESGPAALEAIQKQKPDVLICDLSMPQMDGLELLQKIRDLGREIGSVPAIACGFRRQGRRGANSARWFSGAYHEACRSQGTRRDHGRRRSFDAGDGGLANFRDRARVTYQAKAKNWRKSRP